MGGSSKQTIGYKYFAGLMVVIGNRIEKLIDINPDNRGWIMTKKEKEYLNAGNVDFIIDKKNIFGGSNQEGGWLGHLYVHIGDDNQEQNPYLKAQIGEDVSAYPNLSYLVFGGASYGEDGQLTFNNNKGFELVSMSGMLKDFMLWVKRTRIKNDGNRQWYEKNQDGDIVCEIGAYSRISHSGNLTPTEFICTAHNKGLFDVPIDRSEPSSRVRFSSIKEIDDTYFKPNVAPVLTGGSNILGNKTNPKDMYSIAELNIPAFNRKTCVCSLVVYRVSNSFRIAASSGIYSLTFKKTTVERISGLNVDLYTDHYEVVFNSELPLGFRFIANGSILQGDGSGKYTIHSEANVTFIKCIDADYDKVVSNIDINPIHKIREILTDYDAMNKSESLINDINFKKMADRIYNEGLGISWSITEKSCKEALDELLYHIEAGLRINRQTGLYEAILFRDDLVDFDGSLFFNESNIKSINFDIANLDESISSINVSYYDRELIKDSSFLLYENGLERTRGFSISENIDFPYFMNRRNAELVGNWKLKQLSSPTWKGSFKTGIAESRKINKYDVVKLSWKNKGLVDLPVRILNINLGDGINNTVTLDFIEVIPYSNIDYTRTIVDPPIDDRIPPQSNINVAFEMPYYEAVQLFNQTQVDLELSQSNEIGYLMASSARPQNNSLNAILFSDMAKSSSNFSRAGVINYCPALSLNKEINQIESILKVKDINGINDYGVSKFSGATSGTWIFLNNEIMVYESFNSDSMEITVKRGALDTIPKKHTAGTIFFSDEFSGFDQNQYILGDIVRSKSLTTTPSAIEDLTSSQLNITEMNARAIRPYPPANVKINDLYYPETTIASNDINVTWVDRNRLQQTGGNIIGFYDGSITRESGVTYSIEISSDNVVLYSQNGIELNSHEIPSTVLIQNKPHKIRLWSKRDDFESFQIFEHNIFVEAVSLILTATVHKDKVDGSTAPEAMINVFVDESLTANMRFDGSNIKGKTLPNSTITIEVQE